jgi:hypothetical protein
MVSNEVLQMHQIQRKNFENCLNLPTHLLYEILNCSSKHLVQLEFTTASSCIAVLIQHVTSFLLNYG